MIRSMTGYASHRETFDDSTVLLEIKTLNHKAFDFHYYSPRSISMLEMPFRDFVKQHIPRGRIEVFLKGSHLFTEEESIQPNLDVAKQYADAGKQIADHFDIVYAPRADDFLTLKGVLDFEETTISMDECWNRLRPLAEAAVLDVVKMKEKEGAALKLELETLLDKILQLRNEVAELRPNVLEEYRQKLLDRIEEWNKTIELDENRVIQEIAFFTDRSDIQEELVRLQGHIDQIHSVLNDNTGGQNYNPVGRRLDFLCQELFREINTIGSKSSHLEISKRVVEMKSTVDQLREQIQNIE